MTEAWLFLRWEGAGPSSGTPLDVLFAPQLGKIDSSLLTINFFSLLSMDAGKEEF